MEFSKKTRINFLYKKFIQLRLNVQNRTKILKFKRKKWLQLIQQYSRKLQRFNKFKLKDQTKYQISKYAYKGKSRKKQFKNNFNSVKKFKLYYGSLSRKDLKKNIHYMLKKKTKNLSHINILFLELFEKRLDTILFRAKFSKSIRNSQQLISHGKILVNQRVIKSSSYKMKEGDIISVKPQYWGLIEKNLKYYIKNKLEYRATIWPIPPKHITINYKTLEICFNKIRPNNFAIDFHFNLNIEKILINHYSH